MKTATIIWNAHLKSALNALPNDPRAKIAWFFALSIDCGVGLWSINQLLAHVSQWQAAGTEVLRTHLWQLFCGAWIGIGLFAALSTMTLGFGGDQPRLLMTVPLPPAARFRALYGLMFFEGIGNWLMLAVIMIGIPLIILLGWQAFVWLLLLLLGVTIAVWMSLVTILIIFRYVLPYFKKAFLIALVTCIGIGFVYIALHMFGITSRLSVLSAPAPLLVNVLCLIVLILVAGPFAGFTGKLYEEAFHEMEGRSRSHTVINVPGIRLLSKLLRRYRNLTGALLVKGLLNQSRNVFTWGRVIIILVCIGLFPLIRTLLASFGISRMLLAVVYAAAVAVLAVIDYAPYAISSEGSRLIYYLVTQAGIKTYLRSRLMVLLIATLLVGLTISLVMSWWIGLSIIELAQVVMMVSLIVIAYTAFCVWGSSWDEDPNLVSEGMMPVISQEELPFTPKRLQLLGLGFLLNGMMFLLVWKLPVYLSMPALFLLDAIVLILGWHFSNAQIRGRLLKNF
jgi:hypothetical protein